MHVYLLHRSIKNFQNGGTTNVTIDHLYFSTNLLYRTFQFSLLKRPKRFGKLIRGEMCDNLFLHRVINQVCKAASPTLASLIVSPSTHVRFCVKLASQGKKRRHMTYVASYLPLSKKHSSLAVRPGISFASWSVDPLCGEKCKTSLQQ